MMLILALHVLIGFSDDLQKKNGWAGITLGASSLNHVSAFLSIVHCHMYHRNVGHRSFI